MNDNHLKHIIVDEQHMYVVDLPCVGEIINNGSESRIIVRREWRLCVGVAKADPVYYSQVIPELNKDMEHG